MTTQVVDIQILGRTLKLNCPVDELVALDQAARDLEHRLDELRRKVEIMNSDKLLITAALNISYELTQEKNKNSQLIDRIAKIQQLLDNSLKNVNS